MNGGADMNTIFEFRQIGQSWGEEDSLEIKIFEDGSLQLSE